MSHATCCLRRLVQRFRGPKDSYTLGFYKRVPLKGYSSVPQRSPAQSFYLTVGLQPPCGGRSDCSLNCFDVYFFDGSSFSCA